MINHAMFQRNGRVGYVLKPLALRTKEKDLLTKKTTHTLDITVCPPLSSVIDSCLEPETDQWQI